MADDHKRSLLDMNRLAALEERSLSDWLYRVIRQRIYGDAARLSPDRRSTSATKVDQE